MIVVFWKDFVPCGASTHPSEGCWAAGGNGLYLFSESGHALVVAATGNDDDGSIVSFVKCTCRFKSDALVSMVEMALD